MEVCDANRSIEKSKAKRSRARTARWQTEQQQQQPQQQPPASPHAPTPSPLTSPAPSPPPSPPANPPPADGDDDDGDDDRTVSVHSDSDSDSDDDTPAKRRRLGPSPAVVPAVPAARPPDAVRRLPVMGTFAAVRRAAPVVVPAPVVARRLPVMGTFPAVRGAAAGGAAVGRGPTVMTGLEFLASEDVNEKSKFILGICRTSAVASRELRDGVMRDEGNKLAEMLRRHIRNRQETASTAAVVLPCAVARSSSEGVTRPGTIPQHQQLQGCLDRINAGKNVVLFIRGVDGLTTNLIGGWLAFLETYEHKFDFEIVFQYTRLVLDINYRADWPLRQEQGMQHTLTVSGNRLLRAFRLGGGIQPTVPQLPLESSLLTLMRELDGRKASRVGDYDDHRNLLPQDQ